MQEIQYNGPEMNVKKILILLLTAALILILFLTRSRCRNEAESGEELHEVPQQFVYISPFDSIFRAYEDSIFDWKMLAAIAYVESKFDTTARSYSGAQGLMQIMPATYRHMLAKIGVSDTMAQNVELDVMVAVRYIGELNKLFSFINEKERVNYILGSYNGGSNHIFDAMRIARKNGVNRYNWSSLTPVLLSLTEPEVYTDSVCQYGMFDATETLQYVNRVKRKYKEYSDLDLLFRAIEKVAENNI